ncbi:MAG: TonB-dependent receptor [Saprospiraceae bacterium]|nr:TonB-dependent receptor [Saprospiraceae bacterium]
MQRQALETEQKALEINLDDCIYGTFAEIGAGQEVARHFFQVGAAAGTIAKTMSAYDKVYSDKIYGPEKSGRYVCQSRLYKMLDHEYSLMKERLQDERPGCNFFVFADTVAALNYQKTIKGNGWLGLRFQLKPDGEPNEIVLHVRMLDKDSIQQQQAIGILGVNLVYACYRYNQDPESMITSLTENLRDRISIDMVRLTGPDFQNLDNKLLPLYLVKHGLTDVAMIGPYGRPVHGSEILYKKNALVVRRKFCPITLKDEDIIQQCKEQFLEDCPENKLVLLSEVILDHMSTEKAGIDKKSFLERSQLLCEQGHTVVVSNCRNRRELIRYLENFKIPRMHFAVSAQGLMDILERKLSFHKEEYLLTSFGELFTNRVKLYVYPSLSSTGQELNSQNIPVKDDLKFLYRHLLESRQIEDIRTYNKELLWIDGQACRSSISDGNDQWKSMVSKNVAKSICERGLFGFKPSRLAIS